MSANIKTWQKRMQDEYGLDTRGWKPDSYMIAEINDLRAALAAAERDAARFVFEHTEFEPMIQIEIKHLRSDVRATVDWWRAEIDAAMSTQEQGEKSE